MCIRDRGLTEIGFFFVGNREADAAHILFWGDLITVSVFRYFLLFRAMIYSPFIIKRPWYYTIALGVLVPFLSGTQLSGAGFVY